MPLVYGCDAGCGYSGLPDRPQPHGPTSGRWPANLILSHLPECEQIGTKRVKGTNVPGPAEGSTRDYGYGGGWKAEPPYHYADADGLETVPAFRCAPGCPVAMLDEQSGESTSSGGINASGLTGGVYGDYAGRIGTANQGGTGDTGGASRFFYCPKAPRAERWGFCRVCETAVQPGRIQDHAEHARHCHACNVHYKPIRSGKGVLKHDGTNAHKTTSNLFFHPTVKPIALMRWLVRLVTPLGGPVLDPFCGSGSTLLAAVHEGRPAIGIDSDPHAIEIAAARLDAELRQGRLPFPAPETRHPQPGTAPPEPSS